MISEDFKACQPKIYINVKSLLNKFESVEMKMSANYDDLQLLIYYELVLNSRPSTYFALFSFTGDLQSQSYSKRFWMLQELLKE